MREREFKAWIKSKKKMINVSQINFTRKNVSDEFFNYYNFDDIELIEYIGREDENGVPIYEGDIVERKYNCGTYIERAIVKYSEERVGFYFDGFDYDLLINFGRNLKVIGNIYEKHELLEEE